MSGTQMGLINFGGRIRSTQIGLINFFKKKPPKDSKRAGLPIGLLNFGSKGGVKRVYADEVFISGVALSTGNCSNCSATQYEQPLYDGYQKFNQNVLSFQYNFEDFRDNRPYWAVGYAFERIMYVKYSMMPKKHGPQNGAYFFSYGIGVKHLNWDDEFDDTLSLQTRIFGSYGKKVKFIGGYIYFGGSINNYFTEHSGKELDQLLIIVSTDVGKYYNQLWIGYHLGVQI